MRCIAKKHKEEKEKMKRKEDLETPTWSVGQMG